MWDKVLIKTKKKTLIRPQDYSTGLKTPNILRDCNFYVFFQVTQVTYEGR